MSGALKVLVTGAYGLIGNLTYAQLADDERYEPFGMVRREHSSDRIAERNLRKIPRDSLRFADLSDESAVRGAVKGMDVVVHLAADPSGDAGWQRILESNIIGVQTILEASQEAGVKRFVFGSTNMVMNGYRTTEPYRSHFAAGGSKSLEIPIEPIRHNAPSRSRDFYSASKVFGESLCQVYAAQGAMSCIALRLGWVTDEDRVPQPALYCSKRDVVHGIVCAIAAPQDLSYDVFFVHSDNTPNFADISHTREILGYQPRDRGEEHVLRRDP